jgi:gliding motility-associated-like protein
MKIQKIMVQVVRNVSFKCLQVTGQFVSLVLIVKQMGDYLKAGLFFFFLVIMSIGSAKTAKDASDFLPSTYLEEEPASKSMLPTSISSLASLEKGKAYMDSQHVFFVENKGQMRDINQQPVPFVLFKAEAPGMHVYITDKGLTYVFLKAPEKEQQEASKNRSLANMNMLPRATLPGMQMAWINVQLEGAHIDPGKIVKEGKSSNRQNYFYGHCPEGIYDVHEYEKITIRDVYPKTDWVIYQSSKGGMKYDFVLHPGAEVSKIKMKYEGQHPLLLDEHGGVKMQSALGTLSEARPFTYQAGTNKEIASAFTLDAAGENKTLLGFDIGEYDTQKVLVIDPVLNWYTFFGGTDNWDKCLSAETDLNGNLYLTGYTSSVNFPVQNPGGGAYFSNTFGAGGIEVDAFLIKFSPTGALLWSTYYSGGSLDAAYFVSTDASGNIFVSGLTNSGNFPVQNGAMGSYFQPNLAGDYDAFILKFDSSGVRQWATYYGGSGWDGAYGHCIDSNGNLLICGKSESANFPLQNGGAFFQGNNAGSADAFILKFDGNGIRQWSSFYGGSGLDEGHSIVTDAIGNIFVSGETNSTDFPTQDNGTFFQAVNGGLIDAFIIKFSSTGSRLWSTYYGGNSNELLFSLARDPQGALFMTGMTESNNFPTQNAGTFFQGNINLGLNDLYFVKFDNNGNRTWATFFGGDFQYEYYESFDVIETDDCGNLYFIAGTDDPTFANNTNNVNSVFFDNTANPNTMAVEELVGRFSPSGEVHWISYINGSGNEIGSSIAIDQINQFVYVFGSTYAALSIPYLASNFPLANPGAGAYFDNTLDPNGLNEYEILIAKFTIPNISVTSSSTAANSCNPCDGTATVTASQGERPYSFEWSNGQYQADLTMSTSTITGLCPGNYSCIVRGACGKPEIVNFTIQHANGLPNSFQMNDTSCTSYTAPWGSVYNQSGTYVDTLTASNGCDSIITLNLIINNGSQSQLSISSCGIYTSPWGLIYTQSGTYTDTIAAINGCDSVITLNLTIFNNYLSEQSITSCGAFTSPWGTVYNQSGLYSDTLVASDGCDSILVINLSINAPLSLTGNQTSASCNLDNGIAIANASGGSGNFTYAWSNGFMGSTNTGLAPGNYTVVATDQNGCTAEIQVNVGALPAADVGIVASDTLIQLGDTVKIAVSNGVNYLWSPALGLNCTDCPSVLAFPTKNTTYIVTGEDTAGCVYSRSVNIVVEIICNELFVPDVFSPNNVGVSENEKVCVYSNCIKEMTFGIYNRWGELIYLTNDINGCWDGTHKGLPSPTGVYVYRLYVEQLDGQKIERAGNLTLLR